MIGTIVSVVIPIVGFLTFVYLVLSANRKKAQLPERLEQGTEHQPTEPAHSAVVEAHAPTAAHPPAPADGHGHDSHGGASGALPWLLLALVLGLLALVYVGKKAGFGVIPRVGGYGRDAGAHAPPPLRSAQWTWVYVNVPPQGNDWHTVPTLPGLTIQYCAARTDKNCTDKEPKGFRVKCTDSSGEVREWPEICPIGDDISWQSATSEPFRVKWRDKRN